MPESDLNEDLEKMTAKRLTTIWEALRYTQNDIRLVDDKARFAATLCTAFTGALFAGAKPDRMIERIICFAAYAACAVGLLMAGWVIKPRFADHPPQNENLVFWHQLNKDVASDFKTAGNEKLVEQSENELQGIAKICAEKYQAVSQCVVFTVIAFFLTSFALLMTTPAFRIGTGN